MAQLGLEFSPKKCNLISRPTFSMLPAFIIIFYFYFEKEMNFGE
jgi:hypothetical protein